VEGTHKQEFFSKVIFYLWLKRDVEAHGRVLTLQPHTVEVGPHDLARFEEVAFVVRKTGPFHDLSHEQFELLKLLIYGYTRSCLIGVVLEGFRKAQRSVMYVELQPGNRSLRIDPFEVEVPEIFLDEPDVGVNGKEVIVVVDGGGKRELGSFMLRRVPEHAVVGFARVLGAFRRSFGFCDAEEFPVDEVTFNQV
jgi:hypothetical protein